MNYRQRIELAVKICEDLFSEYVNMLIEQNKTEEEIIECLKRYGEVRIREVNDNE